jgi:hypothetical protein
MEDAIEDAKEYVEQYIFNGLLKERDHLTLLCFSAEAQVLFERELDTLQEDIEAAMEKLSGLRGRQHYTDIGNAMDLLEKTAGAHASLELPQYAIVITDGLHDPPPGTRYPGKGRGVVQHPLLKTRKETVKENWRIWIVGPALQERSRELLAQRDEISSEEDE